jgi:Mg2+-importing ATPase
MTLAALSVVAVGAVLPVTPIAHTLAFSPLPAAFFAALAGMVIAYLALIEIGKRYFYHLGRVTITAERRPYSRTRHIIRRAARFTTAHRPAAGGPRRGR